MNNEFIFSEFLLEKGFAYVNKGNGLNYELKKGDDLFSVNLERKTATLNGSSFALPKDLKAGNKWFSDLGKPEQIKKS